MSWNPAPPRRRLICPRFKIMRIGIDARFYGPIGKGLGRYTQEVVDNIIRITSAEPGAGFDYVVFLSPDNYDEFVCAEPWVKKVRLALPWYSWSEQLFFPLYIFKEKIDLMHFPHFNVPIFTPVKFVVTIHDLILTRFPTLRATTLSPWLYRLKNFGYRLVISTAVRRARRIIAVSRFTKQDIISKFPVKAEKIEVIYEGVANLAKGQDSLFVAKLDLEETLAQHHIQGEFILYVGNAYPHKNLDRLLKAFSRLHQINPARRLVLVGRDDYFYQQAKAQARALNLYQPENQNSPVIFPGYVPDAQLEVLYASARLYVFPSLYEGFGLPPLEAMARGCPVASSDRASLPEILGPAAEYFNPEDESDIVAKLSRLLDDASRRAELVDLGREQVKKYSWWECARLTLEEYRRALS